MHRLYLHLRHWRDTGCSRNPHFFLLVDTFSERVEVKEIVGGFGLARELVFKKTLNFKS